MRITKYNLELPNVLVKETSTNYTTENRLDSPEKIVNMINSVFGMERKAEEYMYMIALNTKCKPIGVFEISHGTINASLVSPREIYVRALLCNATYIIVLHNHPSGDCTPSKEDVQVTRRLKETGKLLGCEMLDHIIIGNGNYYSFKSNE